MYVYLEGHYQNLLQYLFTNSIYHPGMLTTKMSYMTGEFLL